MNTTQEERLKYLVGVVEAVRQGVARASSDEITERHKILFWQKMKETFGDRLMLRFDRRVPEQYRYQFENPVSLDYHSETWDTVLVELFEKVDTLLAQRDGAVFQWTAIYEKYNALRADFILEKGLLSNKDFQILDDAIEQACLKAEEKSEYA